MTDYFKAYAHRVAAYLPSGQRDELFAEIYDDLCEEYADWQADHPGSDPLAAHFILIARHTGDNIRHQPSRRRRQIHSVANRDKSDFSLLKFIEQGRQPTGGTP